MKYRVLFLLPFLAASVSASSIFVISRVIIPEDSDALEKEFRSVLAAELAGYGFSATVEGDMIADQTGSGNDRVASALNQARQTGRAYAMVAALRNFNEEVREFSGYGTESTNRIFRCDFTYRLIRASDGESLKGGAGTVSKTLRRAEGSSVSLANAAGDLVSLAASRMAGELNKTLNPDELAESTGVDFVEIALIPRGMGMTIPEVVERDSGQLYVTGERQDVILDAVTVVLDGIVVGSAPAEMELPPGLHELTLQREGFEDWSRTVNLRADLELVIRMKAEDEAIQRFREQSSFLEGLATNRTLTDAEAEKIRGIAKMFEQSGYRWDIRSDAKSDIRVDTEEAITIEQNNRSLMGDNPKN